jgi:hypothetical protein
MIGLLVFVAVLQDSELKYEKRNLQGWTINIRAELLQREGPNTEKALLEIERQLKFIKRKVPMAAVAKLQKVVLWVSPEYSGLGPRAEYHPGAQWLKDNHRNPAMAKGVEFTNFRIIDAEVKRMPVFVLHELAHSYHDQVLNFQNAVIETAYQHAKASGKYDRVEKNDGQFAKAYAMNNAYEYFAEGSEAYFGKNDFYPFDRKQLKECDPELFGIMEDVWSKP